MPRHSRVSHWCREFETGRMSVTVLHGRAGRQHPPHSPDPASETRLAGRRLQPDSEVIQATAAQGTQFFQDGVNTLVSRWDKCPTVQGSCVEK
jgi:hypothetical protein